MPKGGGEGRDDWVGGGGSRYKHDLCRHFEAGSCRHGAGCKFAHGADDLRGGKQAAAWQQQQQQQQQQEVGAVVGMKSGYKHDLCRYYERGFCYKGPSCNFAHGAGEIRGGQQAAAGAVAAAAAKGGSRGVWQMVSGSLTWIAAKEL